jgi:hypothetical protein
MINIRLQAESHFAFVKPWTRHFANAIQARTRNRKLTYQEQG